RLLVFGYKKVGKSAITIQFLQGVFISEYSSLCDDSYRKPYEVDGHYGLLDILDCSTDADPSSALRDGHVISGNSYLIVWDVSNTENLLEKTDTLLSQLFELRFIRNTQVMNNFPIVFALNKTDLLEDSNGSNVIIEKCRNAINEVIRKKELNNCAIIECSAKKGENIHSLF
ncbi:predicted protein, partial [Naegleria gruberi]